MRPLSSSPSRVASYNRGILIHAIRLVKLVLCVLLGCLSSPVISGAQVKPVKRVLIFYELGLSSPTVGLVDQELHQALASTPYEIELYHEYFETILFPDSLTQQEFRDWYIRKYRDRRPDLIIALGPAPLKFLVDSHEKFFTDIPIVFGGAAEVEAGQIGERAGKGKVCEAILLQVERDQIASVRLADSAPIGELNSAPRSGCHLAEYENN